MVLIFIIVHLFIMLKLFIPGPSASSPIITILSGTAIPSNVITTGPAAYVAFSSNGAGVSTGFYMQWTGIFIRIIIQLIIDILCSRKCWIVLFWNCNNSSPLWNFP